MTPAFKLLDCEPGQSGNAALGRVLLHVQARVPEMRDAQALVKALRALRERFPTGVGFMFMAEAVDGQLPPPAAARAAFSEIVREFDGIPTRAGAIVVMQRGFAGAAIRSVVTGILLASGRSSAMRIFTHDGDAVAFVLGGLPADLEDIPTTRQILEGLEQLRRRVSATRSP
jgi:hypothetical protein